MKKKILAFLLGAVMAITMVTPAFASTSQNFTLGNVSGSVFLSKNSAYATGRTTFGAGKAVTANRTVKVTLTCTYGGNTYTYTDSKVAATNSANYNSTTASVTVYRPSSSYTVTKAASSHKVTMGTSTYTKNLSQ